MRFGLRDSGCDLIERDAWGSSVTSRDCSSVKCRFGFLAVALLTNAARLCGQTIQSQLGVAWWLAVPTGAYHSGDLGGFKAGWQAMGLVTLRPDALPVSVRVDVTYGVNDADDQFKTIYQTWRGTSARGSRSVAP